MKGGLMFLSTMNIGPVAVRASQSTRPATTIESGEQAYGISIASKDALKWSCTGSKDGKFPAMELQSSAETMGVLFFCPETIKA